MKVVLRFYVHVGKGLFLECFFLLRCCCWGAKTYSHIKCTFFTTSPAVISSNLALLLLSSGFAENALKSSGDGQTSSWPFSHAGGFWSDPSECSRYESAQKVLRSHAYVCVPIAAAVSHTQYYNSTGPGTKRKRDVILLPLPFLS